jgi:hypothetical protein
MAIRQMAELIQCHWCSWRSQTARDGADRGIAGGAERGEPVGCMRQMITIIISMVNSALSPAVLMLYGNKLNIGRSTVFRALRYNTVRILGSLLH